MKKNKSSRRNGFINSLHNAKNIAYSVEANTPDFLLSNITSTNIR